MGVSQLCAAGVAYYCTPNRRNNRKKNNVGTALVGSGDYTLKDLTDKVKQIARDTTRAALRAGGGAAGGVVASRLGLPPSLGSKMGTDLGAKLSRIIGAGDYTVTNEVAVNALIKGATPSGDVNASFMGRSDGVRIRHREFIQDVTTGSTAGGFSNTALNINPGLSSITPYLASIAQNFEEYTINGMVFEYVSTTSPFNSSSAMGSIIMAMEYNPVSPAFTNKQQMENSDFAVSARFDKNMMYGVECDRFPQNAYMVRYAAASNLINYDCGLLNIACAPSSTFPVNSVVGELWVSYDITLRRPRISPARYGFCHGICNTNDVTSGNHTVTNTACSLVSAVGSLSNVSVTASPSLATFVMKLYNLSNGDIFLINIGSSSSAEGIYTPSLTFTNTSAFNMLQSGNSYSSISIYSKGSVYWALVQYTGSTGGSAQLTFSQSAQSAVGNYLCDILVTNMGNGFPNTY